jgi:putative ABC transport system permease protein
LRMSLVAAQLSLSTIFLVGSILLTGAVDGALEVDTSHAGGSLVIGSVETYDTTYRDVATPRLRHMPSIAIAGWVATPPLSRPVRRAFRVQRGSVRESVELDVNFASAEYFPAMRMPILDGRVYTNQDDLDGTDAGVVNETLAQRYFADRAVGHVLTDTAGHSVRIVGVVRTRSYRALEGAPQPMVYYPMTQDSARVFYAVVRSHSGAQSVERDVFRELDQAGKTRSLEVYSFQTHLSRALATDRLTGLLIAACGSVALALALVGVYGVMADTVRRRTREIGLRIALGARPLDIAQDVVGATLAPAFAGVVAGVVGAQLVGRVARSFVFEVPAADAFTLAGIVLSLSVVVVIAVLPSVYRALHISPLLALRE